MSALAIARRYAKSLVDLALEQKKLDAIVSDAQTLMGAMKSRDLVLMLRSPIIKSDKKIAALKEIFNGKIDPLTLSFMNIVTRKGREEFLPEIANEILARYNELNNISTATLTTAVSVDNSVVEAIKNKLESGKNTVEITAKTNPDIIGGYVLEMGDTLYDASVQRQLKELRKELANR